jgi:hypothetical protein
MDEQMPEEPMKETRTGEKAASELKVIGTKFEKARMTITNWLLIVASIEVFFGMSFILNMISGSKGWMFWLMFAANCLAGVSILVGVLAHAAYAKALLLNGGLGNADDFSVGAEVLRWDEWTQAAFWFQLLSFGIGVLCFMISWLAFLAKFNPTTGL